MADRSTKIRGSQILDGTVTEDELNASVAGAGLSGGVGSPLAVVVDDSTIECPVDTVQVKNLGITTAKLAADAVETAKIKNDAVDKDKIAADVAGIGLGQNVDGSLEVNVDGSSIECPVDTLQIKALGVTNAMLAGSIAEAKLDIVNAPTDGYILSYSDGDGKPKWIDIDVNAVMDSDICFEDESANCDDLTVIFNLTDIPVANSVRVFLNGLCQREGAGKDYVLDGANKKVTFTTAPETGDNLLINYIKS